MLPIAGWSVFAVIVLVVLGLDLFVFHKKARTVSFKEALLWSGVWILLALLFCGYIYLLMGEEAALNFLTGYLIEKSLSVDNLFVFILIFDYFHAPEATWHKVLFWGILGAIITRALFILFGLTLVQHFHPIIYLFGAFLVITGVRLPFKKSKKINPEKNWLLRLSKCFFPVTQGYNDERFFVRRGSRIFATPLWIVLLSIETADILFAVDSIPAILAITYDPFIVYTSNIFAILGLRSLFFLLARSLQLFRYLHYGIALILVFVGLKMVFSGFVKVPPLVALAIVLGLLFCSIVTSILFKNDSPAK